MKELLNHVYCMDCIEFLRKIPDNNVDSCVTDPPYGLNFMSKKWDDGSITFNIKVWQEVFRVLKPGAHLLSFGGTRTYHRLVCGLEDAGFTIVDSIHHLFGSGFPKGQNIAKTIDKSQGLEGIPVDKSDLPKRNRREKHTDFRSGRFHRADGDHGTMKHTTTLPESELAKQWNGWNTQLKPAHEPIVLARKPISERSIVDNVLRYGTGGLNIDACRIAVSPDVDDMRRDVKRQVRDSPTWKYGSGFRNELNYVTGVLPSGRYPANLILSHHPDCIRIQQGMEIIKDKSTHAPMQKMGKHDIYGKYEVPVNLRHDFHQETPEIWKCVDRCPVRILNEQSGISRSRGGFPINLVDERHGWRGSIGPTTGGLGDIGGAARFFFTCPVVDEEDTIIYESSDIHKIWNTSSPIIGDILGSLMADGMLSGEKKGVVKSILNWKIDGSGKNITVLSLKDMRFIILISSRQTTESKIYNLCLQKSIDHSTKENAKTIKPLTVSNIEDVKDVLNIDPSPISTRGLRELITVTVRSVVKNISKNGERGIESISTSICANTIEAIQRSKEITTKRTKTESTFKEGKGIENGIQSKFFYCAKPSKRERDAGLNGCNIHITVKPLEIVRWLVRLVTPRGGVVLDPFLGSGTTAIAAENEGCDWLGCDISEEYCEIARLRIKAIGGTQTILDDFDMSLNYKGFDGCDDEDAGDQGPLLPFLDEEEEVA